MRTKILDRYSNGWEVHCGRSLKYDYVSPVAGKIKVDWEIVKNDSTLKKLIHIGFKLIKFSEVLYKDLAMIQIPLNNMKINGGNTRFIDDNGPIITYKIFRDGRTERLYALTDIRVPINRSISTDINFNINTSDVLNIISLIYEDIKLVIPFLIKQGFELKVIGIPELEEIDLMSKMSNYRDELF